MSTSLNIVSRALDILGQSPVASIENPVSKHEKLCARWYDVSRRRLLAYHPWDFAEGYHSCSRVGTPTNANYIDEYRLPNDFLELVKIDGEGQSFQYSFEYGEIDWTREGNNILLNAGGAASIDIVYTKNFETVSQFSEKFTEALELYIAANICFAITKDAKAAAALKEEAKDIINEATSIDGQGKRIRRVEYSRAIAARRVGARPSNAYRIR